MLSDRLTIPVYAGPLQFLDGAEVRQLWERLCTVCDSAGEGAGTIPDEATGAHGRSAGSGAAAGAVLSAGQAFVRGAPTCRVTSGCR